VRRATVLIVILLAVLIIVACGKDAPLSHEATATTTSVATAPTATAPALPPRSARDGCRAVAAPRPSTSRARRRSRMKLDRRRPHVAVLNTNCGTIRISLAVRRSPKTTSSFAGLVRNGFYDGLTFHRIAKPGGNDYVIQGGDPRGDGNGGPGYSVVEKPSKRTRYVRGVVAMAKTVAEPPGTSGSQFFIVTARTTPLPPEYALLGRVVGGDRVVSRIARLQTDPVSEMPIDPVVIATARLARR
jgi:cyclophilin family peptidyl-prolyl cis-trans isomerase